MQGTHPRRETVSAALGYQNVRPYFKSIRLNCAVWGYAPTKKEAAAHHAQRPPLYSGKFQQVIWSAPATEHSLAASAFRLSGSQLFNGRQVGLPNIWLS